MQSGNATLQSWDEFRDVDYIGKAVDGIGVVQTGFKDHPLSSLLREEVLNSLSGGFPPLLVQVRLLVHHWS